MRMEAFHWNSGQPLTEAYVAGKDDAVSLYGYHFRRPDDWQRRAQWLDDSRAFAADRSHLADALRRFNEKAGAADEALAFIEALRDPRALCIVGGQQAGLFTGPLLVIYKAITIIRQAREASERLGRPVVPVFWIAGEDHDFDEVNHVQTLTAELTLAKLKLEHPDGRRTTVSRTMISADQWAAAVQQLDESLIPTEFKPELLAALREQAEKASTLTELFALTMARLFSRWGLVLLDSDDPALRRLEGPMFETLLRRNEELAGAFVLGRERLKALGYGAQAEVAERGANVFVIDRDERILLYRDDEGGFSDRKGERHFRSEQLLDLAATSPERLSNNVLTRPLMQDYLLPVLGTVLGAAEVAYWALTADAFRALDMNMPIVVPRTGYTLVEGTVQKNMGKYDLTLDDVLFHLNDRQQSWLAEQDRLGLGERFAVVKEEFRARYAPLIETLSGVNPGLRKLGDTNLSKIIEQIEFLEHKAEDAIKSQHEAGLRQFQRIGMSLLPDGKPQERVYNLYAYLNKYGDAWLAELVDGVYEMDGRHQVCYM